MLLGMMPLTVYVVSLQKALRVKATAFVCDKKLRAFRNISPPAATGNQLVDEVFSWF